MRLVIVSDPHIGDYPYGKTDSATGLNTRLLDFLNNLDQSIDFAIKNVADAYIIVGDIYRVKHPNSKIRKQFASRLKKLIQSGIKTILMTGNHDMTTSSDGAHAMSEMEELSDVIEGLTVVSTARVMSIANCELYLLPFVNRGNEGLLTPQEFLEYQRKTIEEFNAQTNVSDFKYKLFFGHFGTDKSVIGNSFDLDMSSDENENKIPLAIFDGGQWTKVYLGHIHKQQEFNNIVRHVGSIGRVDFTEEKEQKGFYFLSDREDRFVQLQDRSFVTYTLDLIKENHDEVLSGFKLVDAQDAIVRVKVDILQTYLSSVRFDRLESYIRDHCWYFTGVDINVVSSDKLDDSIDKITGADAPDAALKKFVEKHAERFGDIKDKMISRGIDILKRAKSA